MSDDSMDAYDQKRRALCPETSENDDACPSLLGEGETGVPDGSTALLEGTQLNEGRPTLARLTVLPKP